MISKTLNTTVMLCSPNLGFGSKDVFYHSLCTVGAIALLYANVDSFIIKLIGRWFSNEMLPYLHIQADTLTRNFFQLMLTYGDYYFLPQQEAPCF